MARAVAFSPDGRHLVAGSEDGFATVWDVADGREVHRLPERHENTALCVAFSPDGRLLVTGSWSGVLRAWDAQTGRPLRNWRGHTHRISAVAFSPDGRRLATSSFDRTVKVWDAATGESLQTLVGHAGLITGLAFSRDGRRLFSGGGEDKVIKVWDPVTGREVLNLRGPALFCYCLVPGPDDRLASGSADGAVQIWDATPLKGDEGRDVLTREHDEEVWSVAYSRDGRYLASATWSGAVQLWDARTDAPPRTLRGPQDILAAFGVAFRHDGQRLAAAWMSPDGIAVVKVWATATGREDLDEIREHTSGRFWVTFDPTGRYLIREGPDHAVQVRDGKSGEVVGIVGRHERAIWGSAFSPDGRRLATASNDYTVRVWAWDPAHLGRPRDPEPKLDVRALGFGNRVAFSPDPDGLRLATGGEGHVVKIWDAKSGRVLETLRGHTGDVWALAFSPGGRWLASAGEDTTVRLWDAKSWRLQHTFRGHRKPIMSLAFSPDSRRLASGSRDRTMKIWDTTRWAETTDR
jgi:WD40 repeat protein